VQVPAHLVQDPLWHVAHVIGHQTVLVLEGGGHGRRRVKPTSDLGEHFEKKMDTEDSRKRRREADAADAAPDAALFGDDSMEDTQEEQPRVPVGRFMTAQEVLGYGINEEEEQEQDQEEDGSGDEELDLAVSEGDDDDDDDGGDGDEGDVILFDDDDIEWEDFDEDEEDIMEAAPNAYQTLFVALLLSINTGMTM